MGGILPSFSNDEENKQALADILKCNHSFTLKMYKALAEKTKGDVCFSTPHLQHALAALLAGAPADTPSRGHEALARLLQTPVDRRRMERGYCALHSHLHGMKDVRMATALRIYTPDTMRLLKDWFISLHKHYSICIKPTNFSKPHEELRSSINEWIRLKTENHIDELIPTATVNETIQLLLICAAYFQCNLERPFNASNTTNDIFYVTAEDTRIVKLMHQVSMYQYAEFDHLKCQAVEIPYKNPCLRFIMLLPFTVDGLSTVEDHLFRVDFNDLLRNMTKTKVLISVPSFRLQEGYDICDYLDQIGLSTILNHYEKPLMNISEEDPPMALSQFNHMLFFEFMEDIDDNDATEAKDPQADPDTVVFRADHPFLFAVLDTSLNMILAFGRINCFSRFTTPVFQRFALHQLEEQRKQYLNDQTQLTAEQTTALATDEIESVIEVEENEEGNSHQQVRFNEDVITTSV